MLTCRYKVRYDINSHFLTPWLCLICQCITIRVGAIAQDYNLSSKADGHSPIWVIRGESCSRGMLIYLKKKNNKKQLTRLKSSLFPRSSSSSLWSIDNDLRTTEEGVFDLFYNVLTLYINSVAVSCDVKNTHSSFCSQRGLGQCYNTPCKHTHSRLRAASSILTRAGTSTDFLWVLTMPSW